VSYKHIFAHLALLAAAIVVGTLLYWSRSGYRAVPALIRQLDAQDDELRLHAVQWLADIGPSAREAVPALVKALHDRNWAVATAAAYALNRIDIDAGRQAVPDLVKELKLGTDNWVKDLPARVLGNMGPAAQEAVPTLMEAAQGSDLELRAGALKALIGIEPTSTQAAALATAALKDNEKSVRLAAAQAMANLISPPKEAVSALTEAFNDSYWQVRFASIESLGQMGHGAENSVEAFRQYIETHKDEPSNEEKHLVSQAHYALARIHDNIKPEIHVRTLTRMLKGNVGSKDYAARELAKWGSDAPQAVPDLVDALKDPDKLVRYWAATALGTIGPAAKQAEPALTEALQDESWVVRTRAEWALKRIHEQS
jgi:HEAT repeat protein